MSSPRAFLLVLASLAVAPAAQDLVGVAWGGSVYRIDSQTGTGTLIGSTGYSSGSGIGHNAMTIDAAGRAIVTYTNAVNSALVLDVDPLTGAGTPIGTPLPVDVRGLATSAAGTIYALVNASPDALHTIDLATGTTTLIGPTGMSALQGLTFHGGVLYGWDVQLGLVTIDPATGLGTDVNPAVGNPPTSNAPQFLVSDPCGRLLTGRTELFAVDPATGVATLIGAGGWGDVRGAEFVPGGRPYGQGCAGAAGIPQLAVLGVPTSPGAISLCLSRGAPNMPLAWVIGASRVSLPIGNCTLLASPLLVLPAQLDARGTATLAATLARGASGVILDLQGFVVEPGLQLAASPGVEATIR